MIAGAFFYGVTLTLYTTPCHTFQHLAIPISDCATPFANKSLKCVLAKLCTAGFRKHTPDFYASSLGSLLQLGLCSIWSVEKGRSIDEVY